MAVGRALPALHVELRASRSLAYALALAHLAAAGALYAAVPQWHWRALALAVLLVNAGWALRRHALLRASNAAVAVTLRGESDCWVARRNGSLGPCEIQGASYVSTWLVVLHLREAGRWLPRFVVIAPDSAAAEPLRRLRVRLRWSDPKGNAVAGKSPSL